MAIFFCTKKWPFFAKWSYPPTHFAGLTSEISQNITPRILVHTLALMFVIYVVIHSHLWLLYLQRSECIYIAIYCYTHKNNFKFAKLVLPQQSKFHCRVSTTSNEKVTLITLYLSQSKAHKYTVCYIPQWSKIYSLVIPSHLR